MSEQYPGGWLTKAPPTPSGPYYNSTAPGIWTLTQQAQYQLQGIWPTQGNNPPIYWIMTIAPPVVGSYTTISLTASRGGVDSSGNFYPSFGMSPQAGPYSAMWNISKIDINGNFIFTKSYEFGGGGSGSLSNAIANASNDLVVSGVTNTTPYYAFYGKYNSSGSAIWNSQLTTSDTTLYNFAGADSSGNLYFAGQDDLMSVGTWIQTNSSGVLQVGRKISSPRPYAYMSWGQVNSSGDYLGGGSTIYEGYLIKINSSSSIVWSTTLGTGYGGFLSSVTIDPTFSFLYVVANSPSNYVFSLWKVDASNGTSVSWSKYSSDLPYYSVYMACDSSGNLYVLSQPNSAPSTVNILKFDSSGTLQWQRNLVYTGANIQPVRITIDSTNSVFFVTINQASTPNRAVIMRLPTDGSQTGTYGSWAYSASSYTISSGATGSWTSAAFTSTGSLTSATSTPTIANTTFTATTAKIA
jgi:hypothetical protein